MAITRTLVEIDDEVLARAAAKLGTTTKKDTVNRALELVAKETDADEEERRRFHDFAARTSVRMAEIDWDEAWR